MSEFRQYRFTLSAFVVDIEVFDILMKQKVSEAMATAALIAEIGRPFQGKLEVKNLFSAFDDIPITNEEDVNVDRLEEN